jgi:hypothetical protein
MKSTIDSDTSNSILLQTFSYIRAHLYYFPEEKHIEVLERFSHSEESWDEIKTTASNVIVNALEIKDDSALDSVDRYVYQTQLFLEENAPTIAHIVWPPMSNALIFSDTDGSLLIGNPNSVKNSMEDLVAESGKLADETPSIALNTLPDLGSPNPFLPASEHAHSAPETIIGNEQQNCEEFWQVTEEHIAPFVPPNARFTEAFPRTSHTQENEQACWVAPTQQEPSTLRSPPVSATTQVPSPTISIPHSSPPRSQSRLLKAVGSETRLNMHQYASLRAELTVASDDQIPYVRSSYGLTAESDIEEESMWTLRFQNSPDLFRNYLELFQYFRGLNSRRAI